MPRQRKLPDGMQKRGSVYYARFRANGRLIRKRLSSDYKAACQNLNELRARADRADFGILDNDCSLAEIKRQWLRYCKQTLRPRTVERYEQNLANIEAGLPVKSAAQVTIKAVVAFRERRLLDGVSPRTVNMDVGALSTMLNWAVDPANLIGSNPLASLKPLPTETKCKQRRALDAGEVEAIFQHAPDVLKPVLRMFACTGIRHDELVEMQFSDIDFERKAVTVRSDMAKNRTEREIPLDDGLLAIIAELRQKAAFRQPDATGPTHVAAGKVRNFSQDHVFVTGANTPWRHHLLERFYSVCKAAGIEGAEPGGSVDIHALRGTFITLAIDHGANPKAVQGIVGHKSERMTMGVYAKATERGKRDAVAALPFAKVSTPDVIRLAEKQTA